MILKRSVRACKYKALRDQPQHIAVMRITTSTLLLTSCLAFANAQIQFDFNNFFGGGGQQQQQQSGPQTPPKAGSADNTPTWLLKQFDQAICPDYVRTVQSKHFSDTQLCPDTVVCAMTPLHCPCKFPHDTKCIYGKVKADDPLDMGRGYVCARGHQTCDEVLGLLKY